MSGFDHKLSEPIREEKESTHTLLMRAMANAKDPNHARAKENAHKNKMDRIHFFKGLRAKSEAAHRSKGGIVAGDEHKGSNIQKALDKHK